MIVKEVFIRGLVNAETRKMTAKATKKD